MPKVTVNMPGTPKGDNVIVPGLGLFKNGDTAEIPKDRVERYNMLHPNRPFPESGHLYVPAKPESTTPKSETKNTPTELPLEETTKKEDN